MLSEISVIIRCKNEELWIGHAIQSVVDHIERPQFIIVDDGSKDGSLDVVRQFSYQHDIKVLSIDDYSPGRALNIGVQEAGYETSLILSAHCVIKSVAEDMHDLQPHVVVFGDQIPVYRGKRVRKQYIWTHFVNESCENMHSLMEGRPFLHNAFAFYRTAYLEEFPFDEKWYGKEDRHWAKAAIQRGATTMYDPRFVCWHHWTTDGATWKGLA